MRKTCLAMVLASLLYGVAVAEDIRLHGAVTAVDLMVMPNKEAVEKATGLTLVPVGNSGGKGLIDLIEGRCDLALTAGDLASAVDSAKKTGKDVDASKLQFTPVMTDEVVFFVNPANPVKKLTMAQIKGVLTGTIKNWQLVGGNDAPIVVFAEVATGVTRAAIKALVLDGEEYASTTKAQPTVKQVPQAVAEFKNGIGGLSKKLAEGYKVQILESDKKVERPLGVITVGEPSAKAKRVIDALKAEVAKVK
ncbi:MAG TPA: substrate-binding domain-containing protein [Planctomycetota bacterium]